MKIKVNLNLNIEKKHFFVILSAIIILAGIFTVYAYNSSGIGGTPSNMGHSVDEIDWSKTINSNVAIQGNLSSSGVCIAGNCKTDWSQVSSTAAGESTQIISTEETYLSCAARCSQSGFGCIVAITSADQIARNCYWDNTAYRKVCICWKN